MCQERVPSARIRAGAKLHSAIRLETGKAQEDWQSRRTQWSDSLGSSGILGTAFGIQCLALPETLSSREGAVLPQYGKQVWQQSGWKLGRGREYAPGYHIVLDIGPMVTVRWDEVAL